MVPGGRGLLPYRGGPPPVTLVAAGRGGAGCRVCPVVGSEQVMRVSSPVGPTSSSAMTITDAQQDVRDVYARGLHGQLVSSVVWSVAATVSVVVSPVAGIVCLLAGGTMILPVTSLLLRLRGGPAALPAGHPMAGLATQIAFTVPLGLLVAVAAAGYRQEWFFPASLVIVGAHYLPFTFLYGMRLFAVLGGAMVLAGVALALWLPNTFSTGGWVGAALLACFALAVRRRPPRRRPRADGAGPALDP